MQRQSIETIGSLFMTNYKQLAKPQGEIKFLGE